MQETRHTDTGESGKSSFILYTDGSCLKNPGGSGGYGAILIDPLFGVINEKSEGFFSTTNNWMEVMAAIKGLSMVPQGSEVELISDSQYLVDDSRLKSRACKSGHFTNG